MTPEQNAAGPRSRKRFVISLEQPQVAPGPARRGKRWPKILAALGIIVVLMVALVVAGGFLWWQHYRTTPAYSLALLVDAVHRNDLAAVNEIADIDKIVDRLAAEVAEKSVARYPGKLGTQQRKIVEALAPGLVAKQNVRNSVVRQLQEISRESEPKPFIVLAIGLPYLVKITTDGDTAKAVAPVQDREVELTLERHGERWRVAAVKDDTVVPRIVDDIMKDFPAIGPLK
jgi:hypothetical protein